MAGYEQPRRPTHKRPGSMAVTVGVEFLVLALLIGVVAAQPWAARPGSSPNPSAGGTDSGAPPTTAAGTSPASTVGPSAGASDAWTAVDLPPLVPVASLQAKSQDDAGVYPTATFILKSLGSEPAAALASRLTVAPQVELAVARSDDKQTVTLQPKSPLEAGHTYRATLRAADGTLQGSWAFQVRSPIHVTTTLPANQTTGVPANTGIEVTFDQDGVAPMAAYFRISPTVTGRFETHGRTQVFVPSSLKERTQYTVTIQHGLARTGTDLVLPKDVTFSFETDGTGVVTRVQPERDVVQSPIGKKPSLLVNAYRSDLSELPATVKVSAVVYRFPSLDAATTSLKAFLARPRWLDWAPPAVSTKGLPVALRFKATLRPFEDRGDMLLEFPSSLPRGRYLLEIAGSPATQAFVEVTDVAVWLTELTDKTAIWVNDDRTGRALAGATVSRVGGRTVGRTDKNGLLVAATTDVDATSADEGGDESPGRLLLVQADDGRSVLFAYTVDGFGDGYDDLSGGCLCDAPVDAGWWHVLQTERPLYRQTDTVKLWGLLADRLSGRHPSSVELRVVTQDWSSTEPTPPVATATVTPGPEGAFSGSLALQDVPYGTYTVEALVGGKVVSRSWLQVELIRKPSYALTLTTDHTAVIDGARVVHTVTATFYDGTPAPGIRTVLRLPGGAERAMPATGADGVARVTLPVHGAEDWDEWYVSVSPAGAEEGDIGATATVVVFPARIHLDAAAVLKDRSVRVTGAAHQVDLAKVEEAIAAGTWAGDRSGAAVSGLSIGYRVTEHWSVQVRTGSAYDPIEKVVVPRFQWQERSRTVATGKVRSSSGGTFAVAVTIADPTHSYTVDLSTKDPKGRTETTEAWAGQSPFIGEQTGISLASPRSADPTPDAYATGEVVRATVMSGDKAMPSGGANRYLYIVAHRGLVEAVVTTSSAFSRTFAAADAPNFTILAVAFAGHRYVGPASLEPTLDLAARRLTVAVTADRARYAPGDSATLSVRVRDPSGQPVAAVVTLQAVDQKLYDIAGFEPQDPLDELYARVWSGIVGSSASQDMVTGGSDTGTGGDGGARSDFRDTLLFRQVRTGSDGRASVTMKLSDDLTSWHVAASAMTADLKAGLGQSMVPVGLPFFVDATIAPEYLVADRPSLLVRAYGSSLKSKDAVTFTVSSASLKMAPVTVKGVAFTQVAVPLPTLAVGPQTVTIRGTAVSRKGPGGEALADGLVRTFSVVGSRLTAASQAYTVVDGSTWRPGGAEMTRYTFLDAGRGRVLPVLQSLATAGGGRLDRSLAQSVAVDLLASDFGQDRASLPAASFDQARYEIGMTTDKEGNEIGGGIPLLPYSGPDPWLAARVALVAPDRVDAAALGSVLASVGGLKTTSRELAIGTTAGLAALGEAGRSELVALSTIKDLTVRERLWVALGFAAVGDDASALAIERDLLATSGQRLGNEVRLRTGTATETLEATALAALVAAKAGDPVAPALAEYVLSEPWTETLYSLEMLGYVEGWLERTPAAAASFAYTVDGARTVVDLAPGQTRTVTLTPAQRATLRLEAISGTVGALAAWRAAVSPDALPHDASLKITRTTPSSTVPAGQLVRVSLSVSFGKGAPDRGYVVTELAPSGLVPLWWSRPSDGNQVGQGAIEGQRVTFWVDQHTSRAYYYARVASPGTYRWEPAVVEMAGAPDIATSTATASFTIRNP